MKNIHVLPTDKPSRVRIGNNENFVIGLIQNATVSKNDSYTNQHISITNDEEIKIGDWFAVELFKITGESRGLHIEKCIKLNDIWCNDFDVVSTRHKGNCNKIILTTDQDLIKDGVQEIDDEFLEWFVKNTSCEKVEVVKGFADGTSYGYNFLDYKIIIPQEEPKQETLEEFIQKQLSLGKYQDQESAIRHSIELGAKWQQEQWEEDLKEAFSMGRLGKTDMSFKEWFEQFKNK